jgi:amino acid transporter
MVISGFFLNQVLAAHAGIHLGSEGWFWWFLILLAVLTVIALLDIRISTRTQLVIGAASVAAILLLLFIVLAKGGDSGVTFVPLTRVGCQAFTACSWESCWHSLDSSDSKRRRRSARRRPTPCG